MGLLILVQVVTLFVEQSLMTGLSRHLFKEFCLSTFMSMAFFSNIIKYAADVYFVFSIDILNRSLMN